MRPMIRSLSVALLILSGILPLPARAFFDFGGFNFGGFDLGGITSGFVDTATGGQAIGRLFEGALPALGVGLVVGGIVQTLEGGGSGGGGEGVVQYTQTGLVGGSGNPYLGPVITNLERKAYLEQLEHQRQTITSGVVSPQPQNDPYAGLPAYQAPQNSPTQRIDTGVVPLSWSTDSSFFSYTPQPLPLDAREKPLEGVPLEKDIPRSQAPTAGTQSIPVAPPRSIVTETPTKEEDVLNRQPQRQPSEGVRVSSRDAAGSGDGSLRVAYGNTVLVVPRAQLEASEPTAPSTETPRPEEPGTFSRLVDKTAFLVGRAIGSVLDGTSEDYLNSGEYESEVVPASSPKDAVARQAEIARAVEAVMQSAPDMEPALHTECMRLVAAMMLVYEFDPQSINPEEYAAAQALVRAYEAGEYKVLSDACKSALEKARTLPEIWKMGDAGTVSPGLTTALLERTSVELLSDKVAGTAPVLIPPPENVTDCTGASCVKRSGEADGGPQFPSAEGTVRRTINGVYAWLSGLFGAAKKTPEPPPAPKPFEPTIPLQLTECQDIARSRWMLRFAQDGASIPAATLAEHRARLAALPQDRVASCVLNENVCEAAVFNLILLREVAEGRLSFPGEGQEHFKANLEDANKFLIAECRRNSSNPPKAKIWGLRPVGGY